MKAQRDKTPAPPAKAGCFTCELGKALGRRCLEHGAEQLELSFDLAAPREARQ